VKKYGGGDADEGTEGAEGCGVCGGGVPLPTGGEVWGGAVPPL